MSPKRLDSNISNETFTGGFPANIPSNSIAFILFYFFFSLRRGRKEGGKRGVCGRRRDP